MPKRATLTYTSEDAPSLQQDQLFVYYCKYSGRHAFTTDADIRRLPRRRTDNARVLDTSQYFLKLYTTDGGIRLIKRKDGRIERQHRLNVGKLPVAYRSEEEGTLLYVLHDAVSTYVLQDSQQASKVLVPPCIVTAQSGATQVRLELEDRAHKRALVRITADAVRLHITTNMGHLVEATAEILEYASKILGCRISQLQLMRGSGARSKHLMVDHLSPEQVYERFAAALAKSNAETDTRKPTAVER